MELSEIIVNVFFYLFAAGAVIGAIAVAVSRNIVRSAFALLAVLCSVAALYGIMKADFVAIIQILVYIGGILVLIVFAIMLTHRITDVKISNESVPGPAAFFGCLCLLFALVMMVRFFSGWERGAEVIPARAGAAVLRLGQYQADGKTGLAWGGRTFEKRAVVSVEVANSIQGVTHVEIQAVPEKWDEVREVPVPAWGDGVSFTAPLEGEGPVKILLPDLSVGKWHWRARLIGTFHMKACRHEQGEAHPVTHTPWTRTGDAAVFDVHDGVTKPVALALAGPYLFAFEVVSVLLLAALVGAAFLARKEVRE